jgi:Ras-related GTP-binding protein A/B
VFGSSIHDETLYKVRHPPIFCLTRVSRSLPRSSLFPLNASVLSKYLTTFAQTCSEAKAILFERKTFLVIATSAPPHDGSGQAANDLSSTWYGRMSELIKALKHFCAHVCEQFHALNSRRRRME